MNIMQPWQSRFQTKEYRYVCANMEIAHLQWLHLENL
jgi:hypothetical protein